MSTTLARLIGIVLVLLSIDAANAAGVQRCIGDNGEPFFSDNCGNRHARTQRARPAPRSVPVTPVDCARTPQQLEDLVRSALRSRNGIRLSGLVLWRGGSVRGARGDVRRLHDLLKFGWKDALLRSATVDDETMASSDGAQTRIAPTDYDLVVTSVDEAGGDMRSQERWFGVARDHGCYWMTLREDDVRHATTTSVATVHDPWPLAPEEREAR